MSHIVSISELMDITKEGRKAVEEHLEGSKSFHPAEATVYNGLKPDDYAKVRETLKAIPFSDLFAMACMDRGIKVSTELLTASGTTLIAGAAYLVPDKLNDVLMTSGCITDIVPEVSPIVSCPGSSLKVDVEADLTNTAALGYYRAHWAGSGGQMPDETIKTSQVTITPRLFEIKPRITNELIEDSQFDILQFHLERAAQQMGEFSTLQWLKIAIAAATGDGTQNTATGTTTGKTYIGDLYECWNQNYQDRFVSDTIILGPEPMIDVKSDGTVSVYSNEYHTRMVNDPPLQQASLGGMRIFCVPMSATYTTGDGALYISSKWHSLVFNKDNFTKTVRKRWMKLEKFSDPVRDLVGATITARQASATIYNDASCELTEN
jgi:hypothetical protein